MWKLVMRGERGSPFTELGSYANVSDAARVILKTENNPQGAISFRVYVDALNPPSDAQALSRLDYQSGKRYYPLTQPRNRCRRHKPNRLLAGRAVSSVHAVGRHPKKGRLRRRRKANPTYNLNPTRSLFRHGS